MASSGIGGRQVADLETSRGLADVASGAQDCRLRALARGHIPASSVSARNTDRIHCGRQTYGYRFAVSDSLISRRRSKSMDSG